MATSGGLLATCGVPPLATPHARLARLRLIAFSQASSKRCGLLQGRTAHALNHPGRKSRPLTGFRAFSGLLGQCVADDASPSTCSDSKPAKDCAVRTQRISPLNPAPSPNSETPKPRTGQFPGLYP